MVGGQVAKSIQNVLGNPWKIIRCEGVGEVTILARSRKIQTMVCMDWKGQVTRIPETTETGGNSRSVVFT